MAAVVTLAACGSSQPASVAPTVAPLAPAVQHRQLNVAGLARTYRLYTPPSVNHSKAAALVLVLGGVGNSADSMVQATGFDQEADTGRFVVAYADGVNQTWNAGYCCLLGATTAPDDVAFLGRVIDDVEATVKIDPAQVFAVGVSAGAMMAYRLGCELADRIAGVGSVAGAMILNSCQPAKPVSVIEIHGTADGEVPYAGGHTAGGATQPSPPTMAVVQRWATLDTCDTTPTVQTQAPVTTTTWSSCAVGTSVRLVTVDGGGHTWFANGFGPISGAVDATHEIWSYLSTHTRSS